MSWPDALADPDRSRQISIESGGHRRVRRFNESIDPHKDHLSEILARGRFVRSVTLSDGDSYESTFEGPVHEEAP